MKRYTPLIIVSCLICIFLLWFVYAMKHGYFATNYGGSHNFNVYSTIEELKYKCDSIHRICDSEIMNNGIYKDSLTSEKTILADNYLLPIKVDNEYIYLRIKIIGSSQKDKSGLLIRCFSYDRNFYNPITIGDANKKEREKILNAFEKQILSQLRIPYEESWAQYY